MRHPPPKKKAAGKVPFSPSLAFFHHKRIISFAPLRRHCTSQVGVKDARIEGIHASTTLLLSFSVSRAACRVHRYSRGSPLARTSCRFACAPPFAPSRNRPSQAKTPRCQVVRDAPKPNQQPKSATRRRPNPHQHHPHCQHRHRHRRHVHQHERPAENGASRKSGSRKSSSSSNGLAGGSRGTSSGFRLTPSFTRLIAHLVPRPPTSLTACHWFRF